MVIFRGVREGAAALILAGLILVIAACGGQGSSGRSPSAGNPRPSSTVERVTTCAALAQRKVTPCPPIPPPQLQGVVATNGAPGTVKGDTAQQWTQAFIRAWGYYTWAYEQGSAEFLLSGAIAPGKAAQTNIYRVELEEITQARQTQGTLQVQPMRLAKVMLVSMPQGALDAGSRLGLQPQPFGFVVETEGPGQDAIRMPDGTTKVLAHTDAGQIDKSVMWGIFKMDPQLGAIWYSDGFFDCQGSPDLAQTCASLA